MKHAAAAAAAKRKMVSAAGLYLLVLVQLRRRFGWLALSMLMLEHLLMKKGVLDG